MVFDNTADGRSAPGCTGVNHIHVGGKTKNLLFDTNTSVVLGIVYGHMDKGMSTLTSNQVSKILNRRFSGEIVNMRVVDNKISKV